MTDTSPLPVHVDDPGLTAYALGELEGAEAARFAAAVEASVDLQAAVAEIRTTAQQVASEMQLEQTVELSAARRAEIVAKAERAVPVAMPSRQRRFGRSKRVAVVAATVLLVPCSWYAFQATFPRVPQVAERFASEALPATYHYTDHYADRAVEKKDVFHHVRPELKASPASGSQPGKPRSVTEIWANIPAAIVNQKAWNDSLALGDQKWANVPGNQNEMRMSGRIMNRSALAAQEHRSPSLLSTISLAFPYRVGADPTTGDPDNGRISFGVGISDPATQEAYRAIVENPFVRAQEHQLSTFSIDVDTAAYSNMRRFLQGGQLPPPNAVRVEELINYFAYQYPQPQDGRPFSVQTDIATCPWEPSHQLVRIGLKGREVADEQRPPANLVFLVDVSGSMSAANKLPLVRQSLTTLIKQLSERDRIAIVTYAGEAGVRLPSTPLTQRDSILEAIAGLASGGSTNGSAGIATAYDIAAQEFIEKGTNRVILCTDGDFNVGVTSDEALVQIIQTRAKGGVFLSVFGFGMGNLKDGKLEQLADQGNGQYGYIDDQSEANKVFVQELSGTLVTIAKDVKIQVDFNSEAVAEYRLLGYENRLLAKEDFQDDKKDAGEIGAGHTVTALYEIVPAKDLVPTDQTRWLTVNLRYKQPDASTSELLENPLLGRPGQLKLTSGDFQFVAGVAAFGMLLRHSQHAGQANWTLVKELVQSGLSFDPHGHRKGLLSLVAQAESLMGPIRPVSVPAADMTAGGKYKSLLRRLHVPADSEQFGQFKDLGMLDRKSYAGAENLPAGYWVYVAPYWYLWAETTGNN